MKYYVLIITVFFFSVKLSAGTVDTVSVYSNSMHKQIKAVIIKPDTYGTTENGFPVVYLLHGYGGWYSNWIIRVPELKDYADMYQTIIVCPDGDKSSWYFDSPVDSAYRYETFISFELVAYVDRSFKTLTDKKHRAITGLSMGGHGALMLGIRHQDVFGAAGSMSGAVELTKDVARFGADKLIGDSISHTDLWNAYSVYSLVDSLHNKKYPIMIDCGTGDIFIRQNRRLHEKLMKLNIRHSYMERTGIHNWNYWTTGLPYQMIFFRTFWEQNKIQ